MGNVDAYGIPRRRAHHGQFGGVRGGGLKPAGSSGGKSSMTVLSFPGLLGSGLMMGLITKAAHVPPLAVVGASIAMIAIAFTIVLYVALKTPVAE